MYSYTSTYNNVFIINIHGAESLNKASHTQKHAYRLWMKAFLRNWVHTPGLTMELFVHAF